MSDPPIPPNNPPAHLPTHEPPEVEALLARIAGIEPARASTRRAIERVRAALPAQTGTPTPARRLIPRWPVLAAMAATVLLAFSLALILFPHRLTPREMLARTLQATQDYKGWIHVSIAPLTTPSGMTHEAFFDWNSQTHASVARYQSTSAQTAGSRDIYLVDPPGGLTYDYSSDTNAIQISTYRPQPGTDNAPSYLKVLFTQLRAILDKNTSQISQTPDRGMNRIDIVSPAPAAEGQPGTQPVHNLIPTAVWIDLKTNLLRLAMIDGHEISFSYGGTGFRTIYEAGAPQNAQVVDHRPDEPVMAVVDRLRQRIDKPLPDGVAVILLTRGDDTDLEVNERHGKNWAHREYTIFSSGASADFRPLVMPPHWQDADTDEFFRRLGQTLPHFEAGGDGTHAWVGAVDLATGKESLSAGEVTVGPDGRQSFTSHMLEGRQQYDGDTAVGTENSYNPARYFCPDEFQAATYQGNHADLLTSPDRPGQLCLHTTYLENGMPKNGVPGTLRMITQDWIDPAHDDRPVSSQRLLFVGNSHQVEYQEVADYSGYQNLPAPDGRSYATYWAENRYDANGNIVSASTTEFHFFPGRQLPDIPKKP